MTRRMITPAQRDALQAIASVMLDGAPESGESIEALVTRCVQRLHALPAHRWDRFLQGLDLLASRVGVAMGGYGIQRFVALPRERQAQVLDAWARSPIPLVRAAFQSVRRLILSVHYAHPEVLRAVHHPGPLYRRTAQVPWEGPMVRSRIPEVHATTADAHVIAAMDAETPPSRSIAYEVAPSDGTSRIIHGTTLAQDIHRQADVVVVGTGAGGGVAAARLAAAGYEVVMLESGDWHHPESFDGDEPRLMEQLYADGALRTTDDAAIALLQGHAVGGSSLVNWMIMLRTPSYVLEQWVREAGTRGMTPREMTTVFERIEREVQAGLVPDAAHSANNRLILDGARALGWHAVAGRINAIGCQRCGECGIGCRYGAKQSTAAVYVPAALRDGATVFTGVGVERIERMERDQGAQIGRAHV